jgi:hypothetical protein
VRGEAIDLRKAAQRIRQISRSMRHRRSREISEAFARDLEKKADELERRDSNLGERKRPLESSADP